MSYLRISPTPELNQTGADDTNSKIAELIDDYDTGCPEMSRNNGHKMSLSVFNFNFNDVDLRVPKS